MSSAFLQRTKPRKDEEVDDILFGFDSNPNSPKKTKGIRPDFNRHRRKASTLTAGLPLSLLQKLNPKAAVANSSDRSVFNPVASETVNPRGHGRKQSTWVYLGNEDTSQVKKDSRTGTVDDIDEFLSSKPSLYSAPSTFGQSFYPLPFFRAPYDPAFAKLSSQSFFSSIFFYNKQVKEIIEESMKEQPEKMSRAERINRRLLATKQKVGGNAVERVKTALENTNWVDDMVHAEEKGKHDLQLLVEHANRTGVVMLPWAHAFWKCLFVWNSHREKITFDAQNYRRALRRHPKIISILNDFWELCMKTQRMIYQEKKDAVSQPLPPLQLLQKPVFLLFHQLVLRALTTADGFSVAEALQIATADWRRLNVFYTPENLSQYFNEHREEQNTESKESSPTNKDKTKVEIGKKKLRTKAERNARRATNPANLNDALKASALQEKGEEYIDNNTFCNFLFELIDGCTLLCDVKDYYLLLRLLFERCSRIKRTTEQTAVKESKEAENGERVLTARRIPTPSHRRLHSKSSAPPTPRNQSVAALEKDQTDIPVVISTSVLQVSDLVSSFASTGPNIVTPLPGKSFEGNLPSAYIVQLDATPSMLGTDFNPQMPPSFYSISNHVLNLLERKKFLVMKWGIISNFMLGAYELILQGVNSNNDSNNPQDSPKGVTSINSYVTMEPLNRPRSNWQKVRSFVLPMCFHCPDLEGGRYDLIRTTIKNKLIERARTNDQGENLNSRDDDQSFKFGLRSPRAKGIQLTRIEEAAKTEEIKEGEEGEDDEEHSEDQEGNTEAKTMTENQNVESSVDDLASSSVNEANMLDENVEQKNSSKQRHDDDDSDFEFSDDSDDSDDDDSTTSSALAHSYGSGNGLPDYRSASRPQQNKPIPQIITSKPSDSLVKRTVHSYANFPKAKNAPKNDFVNSPNETQDPAIEATSKEVSDTEQDPSEENNNSGFPEDPEFISDALDAHQSSSEAQENEDTETPVYSMGSTSSTENQPIDSNNLSEVVVKESVDTENERVDTSLTLNSEECDNPQSKSVDKPLGSTLVQPSKIENAKSTLGKKTAPAMTRSDERSENNESQAHSSYLLQEGPSSIATDPATVSTSGAPNSDSTPALSTASLPTDSLKHTNLGPLHPVPSSSHSSPELRPEPKHAASLPMLEQSGRIASVLSPTPKKPSSSSNPPLLVSPHPSKSPSHALITSGSLRKSAQNALPITKRVLPPTPNSTQPLPPQKLSTANLQPLSLHVSSHRAPEFGALSITNTPFTNIAHESKPMAYPSSFIHSALLAENADTATMFTPIVQQQIPGAFQSVISPQFTTPLGDDLGSPAKAKPMEYSTSRATHRNASAESSNASTARNTTPKGIGHLPLIFPPSTSREAMSRSSKKGTPVTRTQSNQKERNGTGTRSTPKVVNTDNTVPSSGSSRSVDTATSAAPMVYTSLHRFLEDEMERVRATSPSMSSTVKMDFQRAPAPNGKR